MVAEFDVLKIPEEHLAKTSGWIGPREASRVSAQRELRTMLRSIPFMFEIVLEGRVALVDLSSGRYQSRNLNLSFATISELIRDTRDSLTPSTSPMSRRLVPCL